MKNTNLVDDWSSVAHGDVVTLLKDQSRIVATIDRADAYSAWVRIHWAHGSPIHVAKADGWRIVRDLVLPTKPGTVIAIGGWWLTRLRPYEGAPSAWELHPMPTKKMTESAAGNGVKAQCVYDDEWVLAEAEQKGHFEIISEPI